MNTPQSQIIVTRFFEAIDHLKKEGVIRGNQTFTRRYKINRWNFLTNKNNPASDIFQVAWLENLVRDYHVNARWILTGDGEFYADGWNAELVKATIPTLTLPD